jgi:hypothetical protein
MDGMEREPRHDVAGAQAAPAEPEAVVAAPQSRSSGGQVPPVRDERTPGTDLSASERAYDPATADKEAKAAADAQAVLQFIRAQAKARAKNPEAIDKNSMLQKRLQEHYLPDYLANPNPDTGKAAVDKIGAKIDPAKVDKSDYWESNASYWQNLPVPPGLKLLIPEAPDTMGASTEILSYDNRSELAYLDVPQMIGNPNTEVGPDADVHFGGKNISQLMHWATGVQHSAVDPQTMRDLFLAYEYYHLEGFNMFGEDSVNDLISEDAGRIMGRQLQAGEINQDNLNAKLNAGFDEARAWVGALIKARQGELDAIITSEKVVESGTWWDEVPEEKERWWGDSTIYRDLLAGKSVAEIQAASQTDHFIGMYSLIYHSDEWQKNNENVKLSNFQQGMLAHKYDTVFKKSIKGQALTDKEKLDAYLDAKAPWVPQFLRRQVETLASKRLKGGGDGGGDGGGKP